MASNAPNTNASQFFITYDKHPTLDGKHTAFGKYVFEIFIDCRMCFLVDLYLLFLFFRVIDGFDALEELENIIVDKRYCPVVEQKIKDVTIHANPLADKAEEDPGFF